MSKHLVFSGAAVLLMAGSAVSPLLTVQAGEVLIAGNLGNNDKDKKHKDGKHNNKYNSNGNKKGDKNKGDNGVRDHGKGEGRDNAGQGKGQGHSNKK